jgi:hypothetical protein
VVVGTTRIVRVAPCHEVAVAFPGWTPGMAAAVGNGKIKSPFQLSAAGFVTLKANQRPTTILLVFPSADNMRLDCPSRDVSEARPLPDPRLGTEYLWEERMMWGPTGPRVEGPRLH